MGLIFIHLPKAQVWFLHLFYILFIYTIWICRWIWMHFYSLYIFSFESIWICQVNVNDDCLLSKFYLKTLKSSWPAKEYQNPAKGSISLSVYIPYGHFRSYHSLFCIWGYQFVLVLYFWSRIVTEKNQNNERFDKYKHEI